MREKSSVKATGIRRLLSGVLAAIMLLSLMPTTVLAADSMSSTITMESCQFLSDYTSPNGLGTPSMHFFDFDVNGVTQFGFCLDHAKAMGTHSIGKTWTLSKTIPAKSDLLTIFADYYTTCMAVSDQLDASYPELPAQEKLDMDSKYLPKGNRPWVNGWVQAAIWLFTSNYDAYKDVLTNEATQQKIADERLAAIKGYNDAHGITTTASAAESLSIIKSIISGWQNGSYTHYEYYKYEPSGNHGGYNDQSVLIPYTEPIVGDVHGWIKLMKVDENGDQLGGAIFTVYQNGTTVGTLTSSASGWSYLCVDDAMDAGALPTDFTVKETTPPSGYTKLGSVFNITVDPDANGTRDTALTVGPASGIPNIKSESPKGIVNKVDAITGAGLGGANIRFVSLENGIDATFTTDASGVITIQWTNPSGDNYLPQGEYTVTETQAPDGYEKDTTAQNLRLWIEYVDGSPVARNSGPITFRDYPKHQIIIHKVDASGAGLAGAVLISTRMDRRLEPQRLKPTAASPMPLPG